MKRSKLLLAAWLVDQIAGDPEWLPHPVRLIGTVITRGEAAIRRPGQSKQLEVFSGAALTFAVVATTYGMTREVIRYAQRRSTVVGDAVELLLASTCLAARNLGQEATSVVDALDARDLPLARCRLARIVGRDTQRLDEQEICRAVIETLAESASDGILAPAFYMMLGGVPAAMAYKAVNTLDSMIAHLDERYFYFGKVAARLDDAANYLPARITVTAMVAAARFDEEASAARALQIWFRDGDKHKSPNAGQPESAMAGALGVRLGGNNRYAGVVIEGHTLGAEFSPPSRPHVRRAIRLVAHAGLLGIAMASFALLITKRHAMRSR